LRLPAHLEPTTAWRAACAELRRTVGESTYDIWFDQIRLTGWDGACVVLEAPEDTGAWIAERFGALIQRAVGSSFGAGARFAFASPARTRADADDADDTAAEPVRAGHFKARYTFDQFVMGDANQLAHAAALAVAENPGASYNPLFLYGPPGLGKTHLLHAIGNYLTAFGAGTTVGYTTVEAFTNAFLSALNGKSGRSLVKFKRLYRDIEVLLIDDVQFLAGKARTEEEFFHTFNAIADAGHQLVLTSDRRPAQLVAVEDRLRDRFQSGLVAALEPPDHATRVAILRKRVELDSIPLADGAVLDLIAHRAPDNIRSLEGILIRLVAHSSLHGVPIDLPLATQVLDATHPAAAAARTPTVAEILGLVAATFQIAPADLVSASRKAHIAWPRQLAMHLARDLTGESLQQIGKEVGGRNHATVLHACKRVSDEIASDPAAADQLRRLQVLLRAGRR
jgi:chromosomal replication initiator protein